MLNKLFGTKNAPKLLAWKIEPAVGGDDCYRVYMTTEFDRQNIALRHVYADYSLSRGLLDKGITPEPPACADDDDKSVQAVLIAFNALADAFRDIPYVIDTHEHLTFAVKQACERVEQLAAKSSPEKMSRMALESMGGVDVENISEVGISCIEKDGLFVLVIANESAMLANDENRIFAVLYTPGGAVQHVTLPKCADAYGEDEYQFCYTAAHIVADKVLPDDKPATLDEFKALTGKFMEWFTVQVNSDETDLATLYADCVLSHPENPPDCPAMNMTHKTEVKLAIALHADKGGTAYHVFFTPEPVDLSVEPDVYVALELTPQGLGVNDEKGQNWLATTPPVYLAFTHLARALQSLGRFPESYEEFGDIVSATMQNFQLPDGTVPTVSVHDKTL